MVGEFSNSGANVALVHRDQEIKRFAPQSSNQPLTKGVRLRRPSGCLENSNAEALQLFIDALGKDAVPIVVNKTEWMIECQEFAELLHRPLGRWMLFDISMQDSSRAELHGSTD